MKFKHLASILLLTISSSAFSSSHGGGHAMHHKHSGALHPMPNLMRVIKMHGDQLNLNAEQAEALAKWRGKSHNVVQAKMTQIKTLRSEMQKAVIDGATRSELGEYLTHLTLVRDSIVDTKLKCRNNMKKILNETQWKQVTEIYRANFM